MLFGFPQETPRFLFHYTTLDSFKSIVKTGLRFYQASRYDDELKLTFGDYINCLKQSSSPQARQYLNELSSEAISTAEHNSKDWRDKTFLACFSYDHCNARLWEERAAKGQGVCFCIDSYMLWCNVIHAKGVGFVGSIGSVEYTLEGDIVGNVCDYTRRAQWNNPYVPYLFLSDYVKEERFRTENEVRVVYKECFITPDVRNRPKMTLSYANF